MRWPTSVRSSAGSGTYTSTMVTLNTTGCPTSTGMVSPGGRGHSVGGARAHWATDSAWACQHSPPWAGGSWQDCSPRKAREQPGQGCSRQGKLQLAPGACSCPLVDKAGIAPLAPLSRRAGTGQSCPRNQVTFELSSVSENSQFQVT